MGPIDTGPNEYREAPSRAAYPANGRAGDSHGAIDRSGVIDGSTECVSCRYELLGLPAAGRCPECGTAIAATLASRGFDDRPMFLGGHPLSENERRRLVRALSVLTGCLAGTWVCAIVAVLFLTYASVEARPAGVPLGLMIFVPTIALLRTGRLVGSWMLAGMSRRRSADASMGFAGWSLRLSVTAQALAMWIPIGVWMWGAVGLMRAGAGIEDAVFQMPTLLVFGAILVTIAAIAFDFFATAHITGSLAMLLSEPALATRIGRSVYLLPTIAIVLSIIPMFGPLIALVMYWMLMADLRSAAHAAVTARVSRRCSM